MSEPVVVFETYTGHGRICAPFNQLVYKGSTPLKVGDKFYLHPDPRVAELEAVLRECRDVIEEAQTYCEGPQWSPSMAHDCGTAIAKIDEVLK